MIQFGLIFFNWVVQPPPSFPNKNQPFLWGSALLSWIEIPTWSHVETVRLGRFCSLVHEPLVGFDANWSLLLLVVPTVVGQNMKKHCKPNISRLNLQEI